jgi:Holliday junction resolvase RusA-like endonuclease
MEGPLKVSLRFGLLRPKGHFGKRGLKPSAPQYPTVKPDVIKLARCVEDALNGLAWKDDSQIVFEELGKVYAGSPGVQIEIGGVSQDGDSSNQPYWVDREWVHGF